MYLGLCVGLLGVGSALVPNAMVGFVNLSLILTGVPDPALIQWEELSPAST